MSTDWVPDACTLPTTEQPFRVAEFGHLLQSALLGQERVDRTTLRWRLDPVAEAAVRDLAARESACCSFFRFGISTGPELIVDIDVPAERVAVLDALERGGASALTGR